ncbi:MAG TPA: hypothetical protein VIK27_02610 [Candidatus Aquilonibacter sp.]
MIEGRKARGDGMRLLVQTRVDAALLAWLTKQAKREGTSLAFLIRRLLIDARDANEGTPATPAGRIASALEEIADQLIEGTKTGERVVGQRDEADARGTALLQIATLQRCGNSFDEAAEMQRIARANVKPRRKDEP